MARNRYTTEQLDWLRAGYRNWRLPELTRRFNARFGTDRSEKSLKATLRNHKIRCGRPPGFRPGENLRAYTAEQVAWLRAMRATAPLAVVAAAFRARFGTTQADRAIQQTCRRLGIRAGNSGRFERGMKPWNLGRRGVICEAFAAQQYAPGNVPDQTQPVGAYRKDPDGYWYLKVSQAQAPGFSRRDWRQVHRLTWEGEHGPLPRGHVVVLLDHDKDNCLDPGNLAAIPRALLAVLNKRGWAELGDPEQRRAMIEVVRLEMAAREAGRRIGMGRTEIRRLLHGGDTNQEATP